MLLHASSSSLCRRFEEATTSGLRDSSEACGVHKKNALHMCALKKKTSFSFLKSRLKKADILGYFHLFLYGGDSIPNSCVLSSQRIHSTRTHIKRAHRRSTCARKAQYLTPVKSERLKSSLIRVCEGERRATHFIFNLASLYPTFRGVASSHIQKKRITQQRTLARWRERQSSCDDMHSRNR